ncbi:PREDICTED: transmembrane emp24 domain-containing protein 6-like [Priapulus caudatus]|uniref:Transmembrane emp24 domain-containing protein 6-like n=1 Tax=Priapulus caudatus TaxID=37621 RepID=A0ABM1DVJ6_PRICU|nr:PREDICTED: transmembrane emp24 domain-containing protein 6-like [Priapulus caudatus]
MPKIGSSTGTLCSVPFEVNGEAAWLTLYRVAQVLFYTHAYAIYRNIRYFPKRTCFSLATSAAAMFIRSLLFACAFVLIGVFGDTSESNVAYYRRKAPDSWSYGHGGKLGIRQRLTVRLQGQERQCYYQYLLKNSEFFVLVRTIHGGAENLLIDVIDPRLSLLETLKSGGDQRSMQISSEGPYGLCIDNASRFSTKTVQLYISARLSQEEYEARERSQMSGHVVDIEEEEQAGTLERLDAEEKEMILAFSKARAARLGGHIETMRRLLFRSTSDAAADVTRARSTADYVTFWSLAQCCVIGLVAVCQAIVLRRMFNVVPTTASNKPRA